MLAAFIAFMFGLILGVQVGLMKKEEKKEKDPP
jgi:hypothetical protein